MSLEIIAETTEAGLTTTAALRGELQATSTADDARQLLVIARASRWAESYVGYPLLARRYREAVAAYGTRRLMLARTPLRSVLALYYGTDTGTADALGTSEFIMEAGPGFLSRTIGWEWSVPVVAELSLRPDPGQEFEPWLVDYVAGYTYDGISTGSSLWSTVHGTTSTGRTLPEDIEAAVLAKSAIWYRGAANVAEKAVGDLRIRFGTLGARGGAVQDPAAEWLSPYRRSA